MKNLFLLFLALFTITINSQISRLSELASGKIELFSPIYEIDNSIYGYFMIAKLEDVDKQHEKFEYILLDKNLNKVANGEFIDIQYKKYHSYFILPEKVGNKMIISKIYYHNNTARTHRKYSLHRTIDIDKNILSEPFYYDKDTYIEGFRPEKNIKKQIEKLPTFEYLIALKEGFLMFEKMKIASMISKKKRETLKAYDVEKNKKWEYTFNPNNENLDYGIEFLDSENLVLSITDKKKTMLHFIDSRLGKVNFKYLLENEKSNNKHVFKLRVLKDQIVIVGMYSKSKFYNFDFKKASGFFKIVLDKEGNEISRKYLKWENTTDFLGIKKNGKTKDGYKLLAKQFFIFNDGSTSILTEKFKDSQYYVIVSIAPKITDFLMLNFDSNFEFKEVKEIEKDKSYSSSDYLYSQRIKEGNGVVFFYRDYRKDLETKKKNWVLGIVSIIDGKTKHEQVSMSSEDYFISPYIAKEGYILLREYNKDSEYDKIRLEKLNY